MSHEANEAKRDGFFAKYTQGERQWVCSAVYSPAAKSREEKKREAQEQAKYVADATSSGMAGRKKGGAGGILELDALANPCFSARFHPEGLVLATAWADG